MIFVINKDGEPLMPTSNEGMIRKYLKCGKAIIVCKKPYTIQLLREVKNEVQELVLGMDVGRNNIGVAVLQGMKVVVKGEVVTRNKEVPILMGDRKKFRQCHRKYKRYKKQRRAINCDGSLSYRVITRKLPNYSVEVEYKVIKNKQSKHNNRRVMKKLYNNTEAHLIETHVNTVKKFMKYLPISLIVIEYTTFHNVLKSNEGRKNNFSIINELQDGYCFFCNNKISHLHHVVSKSSGGSDVAGNLVGLCPLCHSKVHKGLKMVTKEGIKKKYDSKIILSKSMPGIYEGIEKLLPGRVMRTTGYITKEMRSIFDVEKTHANDAVMIALSYVEDKDKLCNKKLENTDKVLQIKQYRRHDRQVVMKENVSRYYFLDGEKVCCNRNRAYAQETICLKEYDNFLVSRLYVKKHPAVKKNVNRVLPGAVIRVGSEAYVLKSNSGIYYKMEQKDENGEYIRVHKKYCVVEKLNSGLVIL